MNAARPGTYTMNVSGNQLTFRTAQFSPGSGSVLHSAVYNRELASLLASSAAAGLVSLLYLSSPDRSVWNVIPVVLTLAAAFLVFRGIVFRERSLELVLSRLSGMAEISRPGLVGRKRTTFRLEDISGVFVETVRRTLGSRDAADLVARISAQHGAALPGLADEQVLYVLKVRLADGRDIVVHAGSGMDHVLAVHEQIRAFLENRPRTENPIAKEN